MILSFLFLLVLAYGQGASRDIARTSRQLDLGSQDIRKEKTTENTGRDYSGGNGLSNDYLPPLSSSSSPQNVVGAQSLQTFDFKSVSDLLNGNGLCKPPLDLVFCKPTKSLSKSDSNVLSNEIPKPSRDLMPPFFDAEENPGIKKDVREKQEFQATSTKSATTRKETFPTVSTTLKQTSPTASNTFKQTFPTASSIFKQSTRNSFSSPSSTTTTVAPSKPNTVSSAVLKESTTINKAEASNELRSYLPPQPPKPEATNELRSYLPPQTPKLEATNELRNYLPPQPQQPEYSAAAQTSVNVIKPAEQNEDHDHHHGHHHGDICSDAFHSFLCAPLKARKRITGALPVNVRGLNLIQNQRGLPSNDREPASSNTLQNEYLPPKSSAVFSPTSASSRIVSTYSPIQTTRARPTTTITTTTTTTTIRPSTKVIPQPSNIDDRFYLPPVINPDSSNQVDNTFKVSSSSTQSPIKLLSPSVTPIVPLKSSNNFNELSSVFETHPTTKKPLVTFPNIIVSTEKVIPDTKFQRVYSPFTILSPVSPVTSTFVPQPSNEDRFYLPPVVNLQPSASFVSTTNDILHVTSTFPPSPLSLSSFVTNTRPSSTAFVPFSPYSANLIPQKKIQPVPKIVPTTQKPFTTPVKLSPKASRTSLTTAQTPLKKVSTFVPLQSKIDASYLPPQPKLPSASNFISTTLQPSPASVSETLSRLADTDRSYLPPDPNIQPAAAQVDPAVAAPQTNNPVHHGRDLCTDPFHSFLCVGPKPRKRITGALPPGFRPSATNTNELRVKPAPSFQSEARVKPDKPLETSSAQNLGYKYPKPINPFPSPSNNLLPSSTPAPSTGYSYPKPEKIFPLPSQQKEVVKFTTAKPTSTTPAPVRKVTPIKTTPIRKVTPTTTTTKKPTIFQTSEARTVTGYQYPKPNKTFPLPTNQQSSTIVTTSNPSSVGYSYPRPQKPFPLPTEQKEVRFSSPKPKPKPKPTSQTLTPSSSVSSSSSLPPKSDFKGYQYPKPQQSFELPERKGYSYPKPEKRFELPTEQKSKPLFGPEANSKTNLFGNLGSAEFIPVNKLDGTRDESTNLLAGYQKFGERLRKRERKPHQ